ncbi:MAG: hypothetical protein GF311_28290 [Candidatus Lokiarchaeota archaeon]|nr:hypothetical protein [Candidatus Lokiarchaeota archaeon]
MIFIQDLKGNLMQTIDNNIQLILVFPQSEYRYKYRINNNKEFHTIDYYKIKDMLIKLLPAQKNNIIECLDSYQIFLAIPEESRLEIFETDTKAIKKENLLEKNLKELENNPNLWYTSDGKEAFLQKTREYYKGILKKFKHARKN